MRRPITTITRSQASTTARITQAAAQERNRPAGDQALGSRTRAHQGNQPQDAVQVSTSPTPDRHRTGVRPTSQAVASQTQIIKKAVPTNQAIKIKGSLKRNLAPSASQNTPVSSAVSGTASKKRQEKLSIKDAALSRKQAKRSTACLKKRAKSSTTR